MSNLSKIYLNTSFYGVFLLGGFATKAKNFLDLTLENSYKVSLFLACFSLNNRKSLSPQRRELPFLSIYDIQGSQIQNWNNTFSNKTDNFQMKTDNNIHSVNNSIAV